MIRKSMLEATQNGTVYFLAAPIVGLVKIVSTLKLEARLHALRVNSPVPLELLATMAGGIGLENDLHDHFASDRAHGEWFRLSERLRSFIEAVATGSPIPPISPAKNRHTSPGLRYADYRYGWRLKKHAECPSTRTAN